MIITQDFLTIIKDVLSHGGRDGMWVVEQSCSIPAPKLHNLFHFPFQDAAIVATVLVAGGME